MAREAEIKLAILSSMSSEEILSRLSSHLDTPFGTSVLLKNRYFDVPELLLNKHRVALRIRSFDDEFGKPHYEQTLKNKGVSVGGLHIRGEWDWPLENEILQEDYLRANKSWPQDVDVDLLEEVFSTDFERFVTILKQNGATIELAIDMGLVESKGKSEQIKEIELELKEGAPSDLFALAHELSKSVAVVPLEVSKAERGYGLFSEARYGHFNPMEDLPNIDFRSRDVAVLTKYQQTLAKLLLYFNYEFSNCSVIARAGIAGCSEEALLDNEKSVVFSWLKQWLEVMSQLFVDCKEVQSQFKEFSSRLLDAGEGDVDSMLQQAEWGN